MLTALKLLVFMTFATYSNSVKVEHAHHAELEALEAEMQIQEALQELEKEGVVVPAVEVVPDVRE